MASINGYLMKVVSKESRDESSGKSEEMQRFLGLYQDRVYNICYQVLHHPQDAEDASQQVLLKLLQWGGKNGDPDQIQCWVNRVALNCAIDVKRRQGRRNRRERLAQEMNGPAPDPAAPDESREAVQEALLSLDDAPRSLIIEHYFEKRPLGEIAGREGCSAVAVWKRLTKAKEELERSLRKKGFASGFPLIDSILGSLSPVSAPADLTGNALLKGIGAAGGAAMASKAVLSTATVATAILALAVGVGGGVIASSASRSAEAQRTRDLENQLKSAAQALEAAQAEAARGKAQSPTPAPDVTREMDRLRLENDRLKRELAVRSGGTATPPKVSLEAALKDFHALISEKGYPAIADGTFAELAKKFGECGAEACRKLEEMLLLGKTAEERGLAAYMLEALKSADSVPSLVGSLREDKDDMVRRFSSHALAMIRDDRAAPALLAAMKGDTDFGVQVNSAYGLAKAGNPDAVAWLATYCDAPDKREYRLIVYPALADVADPSTAPLFRKILDEPAETTLLTTAIAALEKMKDYDSLPALARIIQGNASQTVKAAAEKAYATISGQGTPK